MIDLSSKTIEAEVLIHEVFRGINDKGGVPYIQHCYSVAQNYRELISEYNGVYDKDYYIVALLHDVIEDCKEISIEYLRNTYGDKIVDGILVLTRQENETYESFIDRILLSNNKYLMLVKMADLKHNMDTSRLIEINDKDILRLKKYHKAYRLLASEIDK
jgi:(p)ppGpp synthase/HD superfamily hydrolase